MTRKYLVRIAELEKLLSQQAESLRQKDRQLSQIEETEAFLRTALARSEDKVEESEREIERFRAQVEKLRCMMFGVSSEKFSRELAKAEAELSQREEESDRYSGRENDPQVPRQLRQSRHRRPFAYYREGDRGNIDGDRFVSLSQNCFYILLNRTGFPGD